MFGKTRRATAYYACAPKRGQQVPDGHPGSLWVPEHLIVGALGDFLARHVFGDYCSELLRATVEQRHGESVAEHAGQVAAVHAAMADIEKRRASLLRSIEVADDLDADLLADISRRRKELGAEQARLRERAEHLRSVEVERPSPDLIDMLPIGSCDLDALPDELSRRLFEALRLEIYYNRHDHRARFRVTLTGETVGIAQQASSAVIVPEQQKPAAPDGSPVGRSGNGGPFPSVVCPRQDSNLRSRLRRAVLYPLSYGGRAMGEQ